MMDARGQVYFDEAERIPAEDRRRLEEAERAEQVERAERIEQKLRSGRPRGTLMPIDDGGDD